MLYAIYFEVGKSPFAIAPAMRVGCTPFELGHNNKAKKIRQ